MRKIIMVAILATSAAFGQTFIQHLKCDLETANGASLPPRTISQGTTPLWSVDLYRNGQPVAAVTDGTTRAVVVLAQSATGTLFAAVTNTATTTNGYTIQWPVVGTNSGGALSAPWWYMVLIQTTGGKTYWTGSGRLTIEPSSWSGQDGLGWGAGTANNYAVLIAAEAATRSNADVAINTRIDNLIVGAGITTQDCQTIVAGILPTSTVAYAINAGTAGVATVALGWWPVQSGNGQTGVVVITAGDLNAATNAGPIGGGYYAMSGGVWRVFVPSSGGTSTSDVQAICGAVMATGSTAYATSAGTATTALAVAWSNVTERPAIWPGTATDSVARIVASAANDAATAASVTGATHTAQLTALEGRTNEWNAALTNAAAFEAAGSIAIHNTNELAHLTLASIVYVTNQLAGYVPRTETNGQVTAPHTYLESGLSALTTSVSAANSTGAIHAAQIATQEAFRVASTVNYATNAGNALTVNGLTSTQIMSQATNAFALRSWVLGFSNAPATYNSADATLDVAMPDGTTGQMFEELWMPIKNTSGVPLTNGVCVRVEDASGALSGVRLVACTDTWDQVLGTIGLSTMTTATPLNGDGKITTFGNVNDLDTTMFVEGSNLWLSSTPGQLTMEKPTAAGCKQILIGKCLRSHANQGRISVGVRIIPRPDDIGAVATNDLRYLNTITNRGSLVLGSYITNGANIDFQVALWSNPVTQASILTADQATNIAQTVVSAFGAPTYYLTNTVVVSNSLDFAIPIAGNNIRVRWMAMFLSATNEAATSKRASFSMFTRNDRLCDSHIYNDTNQLYWAAPSASAQAAGVATGTVADASGVVPYDRYAVGNGSQWDFLTATQATATVIFYGCTNKYATTGDANTKISHANYLTPVFYDDDSGASNAWCRFSWTTPYTGTVTTIMRYSK